MGEFDKTIGTLLVGIVFNTFLYGLVTFQFASYHRTKFNDPPAIKYMILTLFLLDTVHSAAAIYMLYVYCVTDYNKPEGLTVALWPLTFTPIGTALAALLTQSFLGYRIFRLTQSWILYGIIITFAVPSFALGMACGIESWIIGVLAELAKLSKLVTAWLSMQVGVDLFITMTLTTVLLRAKTGFRKTDSVLNQLIILAVQTGLFASIFSLGDLATFIQYPDTNFYGMFAIPIGRIYTNTLLHTLLARGELRDQLGDTVEMDSTAHNDISAIRWAPIRTKRTTTTQNIQLTEVAVQKDVVVFGDEAQPRNDSGSMKKASISA